MKTCKACGEVKPLTEYHRDRSKKDGLNHYCKPCTIAKQKVFQGRPPRRQDPAGFKTCAGCKTLKLPDDFYASASTFDGLQKACKICTAVRHDTWRRNNLDRIAADARERRAANPARYRDYGRKQNYDLEPGAYDALLAAQGGRCAICKTDKPGGKGAFHVDHCHGTDVVRGLLCHNCNVGLGHFKDSVSLIQTAVAYIEKARLVKPG